LTAPANPAKMHTAKSAFWNSCAAGAASAPTLRGRHGRLASSRFEVLEHAVRSFLISPTIARNNSANARTSRRPFRH
jgi:hypothetical protein